MHAVLAVVVGLVAGSGLAALVAFPLRRRRQRMASTSDRAAQVRRIPLDTPVQRQRAALVAAGLAGTATVCIAAGARDVAAVLMFGCVLIAVQAGTAALLVRVRDR